jgi:hypothetical protein
MKLLKAILLFFGPVFSYAQEIEGEIELAGFLIGQQRTAVHKQLGPPIQRNPSEDGWIYEFHALKPDTSVYALFKYAQWDTTRIYAIQISGDRYDEMVPFRGLRLGASKIEVDRLLGKPDKVETIEDPPMDLHYYPHKNFSVDINKQSKLFGIQVFGNILKNKAPSSPSSRFFRRAVQSKNIDSLLIALSPDVEIHKQGKIIQFTGSARLELKNKDSEIAQALLGDTESVWYVFSKERAEGTPELKTTMQGDELVSIDKFFDSSVISEIVFKTHAGRWKVARISFR